MYCTVLMKWEQRRQQIISNVNHSYCIFYACLVQYGQHIQQSMDQSDMATDPARGQLSRDFKFFPVSPIASQNLVSRDGFGRPVPRQPIHSPHSARSGALLDYGSTLFPGRRPSTPSTTNGSVPSSSSHAIAYRWRLPPRVRRHKASRVLKVAGTLMVISY